MLHTPADIMIHRPPMVFIDTLLSCSETEAVAQITFTADHYGVHNQFVSETALVECMAQTAAAQQGQLAKEKGLNPQFGMLVAIQDTTLSDTVEIEEALTITVQVKYTLGALFLVDCHISQKNQQVASGTLKFYTAAAPQ